LVTTVKQGWIDVIVANSLEMFRTARIRYAGSRYRLAAGRLLLVVVENAVLRLLLRDDLRYRSGSFC
jgi:hypothetical protein